MKYLLARLRNLALGTRKGCGHYSFVYFIRSPVHLNLEASEAAFVSHQPRGQSEATPGQLAKCLFQQLFFKESIHPFPSKGFSEFENRQLKDGGGEGDRAGCRKRKGKVLFGLKQFIRVTFNGTF